MTAVEAGDDNLVALHASGNGRVAVVHGDDTVETAGATHIELALGFGVEVDEDLTLEGTLLQTESSRHAGLLVNGEEHFQRTVSHVLGGEHSQSGRTADTVVSTEGGAGSAYPTIFANARFDGVFGEVVFRAGVGLRNHVDMGLQDHGNAVLHALGGRFAEHEVAGGILLALDIVLLGPLHHPSGEFLLVFRRMRNSADVVKNLP